MKMLGPVQINLVMVMACVGLAGLSMNTLNAEDAPATIQDGKQVSFTYTLSVDDEVIESNADREPLTYTHGSRQILVALENALEGMAAGDKKSVTISAVDGYGEVNADATREVPLEQIPEDARAVGTILTSEGFPGPIRVAEIREDVAVLDFNHPLAGKDLTFFVTILSVDEASAAPVN